jgi:UDP-2-acetamido-2,6-beta-L-arabino-hexul-4-ose reductase
VLTATRDTNWETLISMLDRCDRVVHLAGTNRPTDVNDFEKNNHILLAKMIEHLTQKSPKPIFFTSSTQVALDNPYGQSKKLAEEKLQHYGTLFDVDNLSLRLPNVFGKWSRPNYNSVVATFCHQTIHNDPLQISDEKNQLSLLYIDDLIKIIMEWIDEKDQITALEDLVHSCKLGELAKLISSFAEIRGTQNLPDVHNDLIRKLYSTYLSFLPVEDFVSVLKGHTDQRGSFFEFARFGKQGQVSFFTAEVGQTRGEHFHHTKVERFVVLSGKAKFSYRNLTTQEHAEFIIEADNQQMIESIPGWVHKIENIGQTVLVVLVWSNELFDESNTDTYPEKVNHGL